jgi:hypothetical protein
MEKIKICILIALFMAFAACKNDEDKLYLKPAGEVGKPVLSIDGTSDIEVSENTLNMVPAIIRWTKSDFGNGVLAEYTLEMAVNESFDDAKAVTVGNNIYAKALTAKDLSNWAVNWFGGLDDKGEGVKVDYYIRIAVAVFLENPTVTVPPEKLYSNSIKLSVLPYFIPPEFPSEMYMIGEEFDVVEMIPVHGFEGHFWAIRYITAGKGFKWCAKRTGDGDFNTLGEDIGFTLDGGDALVAADGLYMIYMDMDKKRISVETAKVYGMGDCFGGWDIAAYPFAIDGRTASRTTDESGELRICAVSDIAPIGNDWWKMEFVIIDGVIAYRGAGNDQDRVSVNAGKLITLDFNAGTGSIK